MSNVIIKCGTHKPSQKIKSEVLMAVNITIAVFWHVKRQKVPPKHDRTSGTINILVLLFN
jgi:hypothetical protein